MRETAIVVGAGGALGQAIVADLVAAGVDILGVARNPASLATLAERHGDRFRPVIADMADDSAIEAVGAAITAPVDMVVHAPGVPVAGGVRVAPTADRKSGVEGTGVSVRVARGGRRDIQNKKTKGIALELTQTSQHK